MQKEIWKPVVGYEGLYEINNKGEIKTIKSGRIIKYFKNKDGYLSCKLSKKSKTKTYLVHRLVAQAFIPNPENKPYVNHKDSNRLNNTLNNVEWCTPLENVKHMIISGRSTYKKGSNNINSKLDENIVISILNIYKNKNVTQRFLSKKYDVSLSAINSVINRKTWKHVDL